MSWAQRIITETNSDQSNLTADFARDGQSATVDGASLSDVTTALSRYLDYDLGKRDRERLELLETSSFSAPLVDSSSRISLRLNDVDRTVCRLLERYNEHAQTPDGDLSLELSDIASSETEKKGVPRPDIQSKHQSECDTMNGSEYLKKCLTCDKTFSTVKQLVAHFMEKPQNKLWIESHDTAKRNEPILLEATSATEPCTGAEPRHNTSSRRMECVDEAIPLTDHAVEYQDDGKQQSAVNTKGSTNVPVPQNQSRILETKRPHVSGQRQRLKGRTVKSSSSDRPYKKVCNKNKTCEVSSNSRQRDNKASNHVQLTESRKNPAIKDFTPPKSSAIHTSGITSTANTVPQTVPSGGQPRNSVLITTQNNYQTEVARSANSIAAPGVVPTPLEIMKRLTSLLTLYQTKVQRRRDHTTSLMLSIPVNSPVSVVPPPKSIPIGTVSCKRKYSSLEKSASSVGVGCASRRTSDTPSGKKKASGCCSVASTNQGLFLRESCCSVASTSKGPALREPCGSVASTNKGPALRESCGSVANTNKGPALRESCGSVVSTNKGPALRESCCSVANMNKGPALRESCGSVANTNKGPALRESCGSVANTNKGPALRESCGKGDVAMNEDSGHMAPTNQFNESNNEEWNLNVPSQSTLFGSHVVRQAEPINTQETAHTPIEPLYPLASSGKWLIYHLPAAVISNFSVSQNQSQQMSQKPRCSSFTETPADRPVTASTTLFFPRGTTPTILRQSLQYPVVSTTLSLAQSHKMGQKVPVHVNQRPVVTLTHARPTSAGIPTPKLAKTYDFASAISKRPTQRLGIQRSAASLQFHPFRVQTTGKMYPKLLRNTLIPPGTCGDQASKHVRLSDATSDLLQPSIILQPIRAPPATGRSLLHVPLLEVPGQRPRATSSPGNSGSPALTNIISPDGSCAVESAVVPRSSGQVSSNSNNTIVMPCCSAQTPLNGSNTAAMPCSSAQTPLDGRKTATMPCSSFQAWPYKQSTLGQELSMFTKFHAQRPSNTKVPTLILKPKESIALVSKETDGSCSPENPKVPGSVTVFGQAAQRFRRTADNNSPTTRGKKRTARVQLARSDKKPISSNKRRKTDSHA